MNKNQIKHSPANNSITYIEAETIYISELKVNGVSGQEIKNSRSALNSWRNMLNLAEKSPIGDEFGSLFKKHTAAYIQKQRQLNKKASTYTPRVSRIKKFRKFYLNFSHLHQLPPN